MRFLRRALGHLAAAQQVNTVPVALLQRGDSGLPGVIHVCSRHENDIGAVIVGLGAVLAVAALPQQHEHRQLLLLLAEHPDNSLA